MTRTVLLTVLPLVPLVAIAAETQPVQPLKLSDKFPRVAAPGTGRLAVQLTSGDEACYPLYYFIPSITCDGHYLVYHRYQNKTVLLWRLDLRTAEATQLTHAKSAHADWRPWNAEPGLRGVLDYRAALNPVRNVLVYFDGNQAHTVSLETLKDETIFELPRGREAIGQNCVTPDGKWFVYIHAPEGAQYGQRVDGVVAAWNFDTREQRSLVVVAHAIHHVMAYDNEHLIINHPSTRDGMAWAEISSGQWTELRAGDPGVKGDENHQCSTAQGITYEAFTFSKPGAIADVITGLYDPFTRRRFEFRLPSAFGYTHIGYDPAGRLWFWEQHSKLGHNLWYMESLDRQHGPVLRKLAGDWRILALKERNHMHPRMTDDRRWILMTGADEKHRAQVFLLDISDLKDSQGISRDLLSATGENDILTPAKVPESEIK